MHEKVLEQIDRSLLTGLRWNRVVIESACSPDFPNAVQIGGQWRTQEPVWVPPGMTGPEQNDWIWAHWDLPTWGEDQIPKFTSHLQWAEVLRVALTETGYQVTIQSKDNALRCRVSGPTAGAGQGCKTIWLNEWAGPGLPGPVALGLAAYHRLYGAEMLGHVEGLLAA